MDDFIHAATLDQIPPGRSRPVFVAGKVVAMFNVGGDLYALDDACPHAGSSLGMGKLDGAVVQCRAHGLRFDVRTGCMVGSGGLRATCYAVQVTGNDVAVRLETQSCGDGTECPPTHCDANPDARRNR